jgi:hypothetical protein
MAGFETIATLDFVAHGAETELRVRHELFPDTRFRDLPQLRLGRRARSPRARIWQEGDAHAKPVVFGVAVLELHAHRAHGADREGHRVRAGEGDPALRRAARATSVRTHPRLRAWRREAVRDPRHLPLRRRGAARAGLQPADPLERARMQQWISASTDYVARHDRSPIVFERLLQARLFGQPSDEAAIREALPRAEATLRGARGRARDQRLLRRRVLRRSPILASSRRSTTRPGRRTSRRGSPRCRASPRGSARCARGLGAATEPRFD